MKKVVLTLGMLLLASGVGFAQDVNEPEQPAVAMQPSGTANHSALEKTLIANENKVGAALMKKDKAAFTALVPGEAWTIDMNGLMKASELVAALDQMVLNSYKITDEKISWVDANTAILTYKWTGSGTFAGQPLPANVYASTVWTKKGDKWVAVFHQESEAATAAKK